MKIEHKYNFDVSNNFIININLDNDTAINLYALSTTISGISMGSSNVNSANDNIKHIIKSQRPDYEQITIPFILTEKWETFMYFYDHIKNVMLNEKTKVNIKLNETFTLIVYITDSYGDPFLAAKYHNTSISSLSGVNREKMVNEIKYNIFDVTFEYTHFEIERI